MDTGMFAIGRPFGHTASNSPTLGSGQINDGNGNGAYIKAAPIYGRRWGVDSRPWVFLAGMKNGGVIMSTSERPLSPHLGIYKQEWTMVLSITHRITGVALGGGTLILVWWLLALASGPDAFNLVQSIIGSWIGRLCLFGWTWALFYHFCNGIRHLGWDMGMGFELDTARNTGILVVVASIGLTLLTWVVGYAMMGGS
jgi:succinate dehydrogenase / fumarate reductase cytochrome b subunit